MVKKSKISNSKTMESCLPSGGCGEPAIDRYGREWAAKLRELECEIVALGVDTSTSTTTPDMGLCLQWFSSSSRKRITLTFPNDADIQLSCVC